MAPPQDCRQRQRRPAGDFCPGSHTRNPSPKTFKTRSELELDPGLEHDAWASWEYPPEFWDRLSKILLTHDALKELDRRTSTRRSSLHPPQAPPSKPAQHLTNTVISRALARFAMHGGPDLRDLRGCPEPMTTHPISKSTNSASFISTSIPIKSKKSTPYAGNFELHLTDHSVRPLHSSEEPDLAEIISTLTKPRASLSLSQFSVGAFKTFRQSNAQAKDEGDVLLNVIPTILGPSQSIHPSAVNTIFGNLEQLTDGTIAPAKPDIYYGAYPVELSRSVRNELSHHIIPSSMQDKPMAPNFFVEVKGPRGSHDVAMRQACYDGAVGSRGMHTLQNYGRDEPQYDGQAYTFSSIYHCGQLLIFAHHPTAPTTNGGPPEYHMSLVTAYAMTNNRDTFVQGATAFRNARDMASQHRRTFIQAANAKASQGTAPAPQNCQTTTTHHCLDDEASDDFVDCTDHHLSETRDEFAADITNVDECRQASALPESGGMTMSLHESHNTSGFTTRSAKRSRQSHSSDSTDTAGSPPFKRRVLHENIR